MNEKYLYQDTAGQEEEEGEAHNDEKIQPHREGFGAKEGGDDEDRTDKLSYNYRKAKHAANNREHLMTATLAL
jgi:hypothetical protein